MREHVPTHLSNVYYRDIEFIDEDFLSNVFRESVVRNLLPLAYILYIVTNFFEGIIVDALSNNAAIPSTSNRSSRKISERSRSHTSSPKKKMKFKLNNFCVNDVIIDFNVYFCSVEKAWNLQAATNVLAPWTYHKP